MANRNYIESIFSSIPFVVMVLTRLINVTLRAYSRTGSRETTRANGVVYRVVCSSFFGILLSPSLYRLVNFTRIIPLPFSSIAPSFLDMGFSPFSSPALYFVGRFFINLSPFNPSTLPALILKTVSPAFIFVKFALPLLLFTLGTLFHNASQNKNLLTLGRLFCLGKARVNRQDYFNIKTTDALPRHFDYNMKGIS